MLSLYYNPLNYHFLHLASVLSLFKLVDAPHSRQLTSSCNTDFYNIIYNSNQCLSHLFLSPQPPTPNQIKNHQPIQSGSQRTYLTPHQRGPRFLIKISHHEDIWR